MLYLRSRGTQELLNADAASPSRDGTDMPSIPAGFGQAPPPPVGQPSGFGQPPPPPPDSIGAQPFGQPMGQPMAGQPMAGQPMAGQPMVGRAANSHFTLLSHSHAIVCSVAILCVGCCVEILCHKARVHRPLIVARMVGSALEVHGCGLRYTAELAVNRAIRCTDTIGWSAAAANLP